MRCNHTFREFRCWRGTAGIELSELDQCVGAIMEDTTLSGMPSAERMDPDLTATVTGLVK